MLCITQIRGGPIIVLQRHFKITRVTSSKSHHRQTVGQNWQILAPLHFGGRKFANFGPQFGDGETLNSCNFKTTLQIEKLKQMVRLRLFLTTTSRFHIGLFFDPKLYQSDIFAIFSTAFNRGRHLYSEGGHHVGHRPTFWLNLLTLIGFHYCSAWISFIAIRLMVRAGQVEGPLQLTVGPQIF